MADDGVVIVGERLKKSPEILDKIADCAWKLQVDESSEIMENFLEGENLNQKDDQLVRHKVVLKKLQQAGSLLRYDELMTEKMDEFKKKDVETQKEIYRLKCKLAAYKKTIQKLKNEKSRKNRKCACKAVDKTDDC